MGKADKTIKKDNDRKLWNWDVVERPISYSLDDSMNESVMIDSHKAIIRTDNYDTLGVVKNSFHSIYNSSLENIVNMLEKEGLATYHKHGTFVNGKNVWVQLKSEIMPSLTVNDKDKTNSYILLANGHGGAMSLRLLSTMIRVWCKNTFNYALKTGDNWFTARHTKSVDTKLKDLEVLIKQLGESTRLVYDTFEEMAGTNHALDDKGVETFFSNVMNYKKEDRLTRNQDNEKFMVNRYSTRSFNNLEIMKACLAKEPDIADTNWGLFNAVTNYVDFHGSNKKTASDNYSMLGAGHDIKMRAYNMIGNMQNVPF